MKPDRIGQCLTASILIEESTGHLLAVSPGPEITIFADPRRRPTEGSRLDVLSARGYGSIMKLLNLRGVYAVLIEAASVTLYIDVVHSQVDYLAELHYEAKMRHMGHLQPTPDVGDVATFLA